MPVEKILSNALDDMPDCLAGALFDLESQSVLFSKAKHGFSDKSIADVSVAAMRLFDPENLDTNKDSAEQKPYQEIVVFSDSLIHSFVRSEVEPNFVAVFVTDKDRCLGRMLAESRNALSFSQTAE